MRHSKLLIGATALSLLAGAGIALPQGAPQERSGPAINQSPGGQEKGKPGNAQREGQGAQPGRAQSERGKNSDQTTGQAPPSNQAQPQRSQRGGDESPAPKAQPGQLPNQGEQRPQAQPQQPESAPRSGVETQGQAGARVQFSPEQRTRIRETVIHGSNAPHASNVTFAVSVGTVVPRTVRLAPLPTLIVDVEPTWRGYMYFIVGDEIIVVEPNSLRIVAVIAV